jgi:hypothetical protein
MNICFLQQQLDSLRLVRPFLERNTQLITHGVPAIVQVCSRLTFSFQRGSFPIFVCDLSQPMITFGVVW